MHKCDKTNDSLARFYTEQEVSTLLVSSMLAKNPQTILDLGCGNGALAMSAAQRWGYAKLYTVDIDQQVGSGFPKYLKRCEDSLHTHFTADVLDPNLPARLGLSPGSIDVAVCNPPYIKVRWRTNYQALFEEVGIKSLGAASELSADLIFLAQNMRLLREGGHAGLIVPDGIITGERSKDVRRTLLSQYTIERVIQLPRRAFLRTEAQTHILVISKRKGKSRNIQIQKLNEEGSLGESMWISPEEGIDRLDYDYHRLRHSPLPVVRRRRKICLGDVTESLRRGSVEIAKARAVGLSVFHTTDFGRCQSGWLLDVPADLQASPNAHSNKSQTAKAGDILIARVGRNFDQQICLVTNGEVVVSDCIFCLRVIPEERQTVFKALISDWGRAWLRSLSRGVGARFLSSQSLLSFPL
jgi:type I restriction enzyme M protein